MDSAEKQAFTKQHVKIHSGIILLIFLSASIGSFTAQNWLLSFILRPTLLNFFPEPVFFNLTDFLKPDFTLATGLLITLPFFMHLHLCIIRESPHIEVVSTFFTRIGLFIGAYWCGALLCLYIVIPYGIKFFLDFAADSIRVMPSAIQFYSIAVKYMIMFGVLFLLPVYLFFARITNSFSYITVSANRRFIVLYLFILVSAFSPPDMISTLLIGLPAYLYAELCFQGMRWIKPTVKGNGSTTPDDTRKTTALTTIVFAVFILLIVVTFGSFGMPEIYLCIGVYSIYFICIISKDSLIHGLLSIIIPFYGPVYMLKNTSRLFRYQLEAKIWAWLVIALNSLIFSLILF
jgi:Sec-independent protein secretion pathway component TatC